MKKNKYDLLDKEPWYKNHPSPIAKWLHNLSLLGFCWFGKNVGFVWYILFNPAIVILYISFGIVYILMP